jgi:hypothetical protein
MNISDPISTISGMNGNRWVALDRQKGKKEIFKLY